MAYLKCLEFPRENGCDNEMQVETMKLTYFISILCCDDAIVVGALTHCALENAANDFVYFVLFWRWFENSITTSLSKFYLAFLLSHFVNRILNK